MHLNKVEIICLKSIRIFFEVFEILYLVNLRQIHLPFNDCVPRFQNILGAFVIIDFLSNSDIWSIDLDFDLGTMRLILLQDLLAREDLIDLLYDFIFIISIEGTVDSIELVINHYEFSFVISWTSAFENDWNISFDQVEFLQTEQTHIKSQIRTLLIYLICVIGSYAAEYRKPIGVTCQT